MQIKMDIGRRKAFLRRRISLPLLILLFAVSNASGAGSGSEEAEAVAGGDIFDGGGGRKYRGRDGGDKRDDSTAAAAAIATAPTRRRVVVEYADERGREAIERFAFAAGRKKERFDLLDAPRRNIVAVDVNREQYDSLVENPHILHVEDDVPIFHSVSFSRGQSGDDDNDGRNGRNDRRRHLEEVLTEAVEMIQANQLTMGPSPPLVCVADSGYALGHPDLPLSPAVVTGSDMVLPNGRTIRWDVDSNGHGTASAGLIAAVEGNGIGYRGVAPGVRLYITRGLDDNGRSTLMQLITSVEQCIESGAKIISLSLGCECTDVESDCLDSGCYSDITRDYFRQIVDSGILVVGAAGNAGKEINFFPASYPSVLSVGGANRGYTKFGQSNFNEQVELAALGYMVKVIDVDVGTNATEYEYGFRSGTSIATPAVAASAALLWSHFPGCTNTQIRTALGKTATNSNAECDTLLGFGVVQVKDAYDLLMDQGCGQDGRFYDGKDGGTCDAPFLDPDPTSFPTSVPSRGPTDIPTRGPSVGPTMSPVTDVPTSEPTHRPTGAPTTSPTTGRPTTGRPTTGQPTTWESTIESTLATPRLDLSSSSSSIKVGWAFMVIAAQTALLIMCLVMI